MLVIDEHHLFKRCWLVAGIEMRLSSRIAFLFLLGFAQRFARDAGDDNHDRDCRQQSDDFQNLLVESGRSVHLTGKSIPRRRADVNKKESCRQHADEVGQNIGSGAHRSEPEKVIQ